MQRVRGAPRRAHRPGLGHDGDEPARLAWPARRRTPRATSTGATARRPGARSPLVEVRIVDDDGNEVPWDGESTGELEVRGPWVTRAVLPRPDGRGRSSTTAGCARATSRRSTTRGYIMITDRAKDVIKSGGEWISSVELEKRAHGPPGGAEAAVIAVPRRALGRAPARLRRARGGRRAHASRSYASTSRERVAKWWLPDELAFVDEVPEDQRRQVRQEGAAQPARGGPSRAARAGGLLPVAAARAGPSGGRRVRRRSARAG